MGAYRRGDVYDLRFGEGAVGYNGNVLLHGQNPRRAPIDLDYAAVGSTFDIYPIPGGIGATDAQDYPRKRIAQRALKRETKNDGDCARGSEQSLNREIKYIRDDCEYGSKVDDAGEQVPQQLPLHVAVARR